MSLTSRESLYGREPRSQVFKANTINPAYPGKWNPRRIKYHPVRNQFFSTSAKPSFLSAHFIVCVFVEKGLPFYGFPRRNGIITVDWKEFSLSLQYFHPLDRESPGKKSDPSHFIYILLSYMNERRFSHAGQKWKAHGPTQLIYIYLCFKEEKESETFPSRLSRYSIWLAPYVKQCRFKDYSERLFFYYYYSLFTFAFRELFIHQLNENPRKEI